jgi:hypothetical protein
MEFSPSLRLAAERVGKRSKAGVSQRSAFITNINFFADARLEPDGVRKMKKEAAALCDSPLESNFKEKFNLPKTCGPDPSDCERRCYLHKLNSLQINQIPLTDKTVSVLLTQ